MAEDSARSGISRRDAAKLGLGLGLLSVAGAGKAAEPYETVLEAKIMVPMRDGIRLATDVYRPARNGKALPGPFPVILERTPYGRNIVSRSELSVAEPKPKSRAEVAAYFAKAGYVVIYQDCRGRYDSEGEFVKYLSDGNDGYDCCKWIVAQPWCNGKIGTMGLSYAAHTQGALGCTNPPGIAAMFLDSGGFSNSYQGGIRQGGAFELKQVTWGFNNGLVSSAVQNDPIRLAEMKAVDLKAWFARMPWKRGHSPLTPAPEYENYVYDQWEHGNFDAYWKQIGIHAAGYYDQFSDAPMVHMSSWFDPYPRTATENYIGLKARKKGPVRLILGPWTHGDRSLTYAGDVDFGPAATLDRNLAPDYLSLRLRWFDAWLKGEPNGVAEEPPVRVFVMGGGSGRRNDAGRLDHGGRWRSEKDWPIPDARNTLYHLHEDGRLAPELPAAAAEPLTFDFDPAHPVPTIGGTVTSGAPVMVGGAFDQTEGPRFFGSREPYLPLAARPDVLVFETPMLDRDIEITGPIAAHLWVSSDQPDTDITIKLVDVYPPSEDYPQGFAMNLTDGILRLRYRKSWEKPEMLKAGEPVAVTVEAFPTANLFKRGHRIRLDISSSNFPHFDVNPNTGAPEGRGLSRRVARNTIYLDRDRPSHVVLPVIPERS
ncbi:CocE/NonD family hydrolase [Bradyrhizobium sp. CCBAU 45384]|uniref:CocE/NonD family hydrolase n=1 Tax=Bradyrhizobium sp. CCBAU 45384 TaxID=858428 RepID=UPI002304E318|nr:CocE/NonD family hydrolase [Bradyrhizobium sp. CCBAU 45384]